MDYFEIEMAKKTAEFVSDVAEDVVRPTSKSIGNNIGLMVEGVMGWLGCWGEIQIIKQQKHVQEYKTQIKYKISSIPLEMLDEPKMNIIGPVIEASKYFFEYQYYRDMFSTLIASACNKSLSEQVHPAFIEIIKQLKPKEAVFLKYLINYRKALIDVEFHFKEFNLYCYINVIDVDGKFEEDDIALYINNYIRLGLFEKLQSYRQSCESEFEELEKIVFNECKFDIKEDYEHEVTYEEMAEIFKCRYFWLEMTSFGADFIDTCIPE